MQRSHSLPSLEGHRPAASSAVQSSHFKRGRQTGQLAPPVGTPRSQSLPPIGSRITPGSPVTKPREGQEIMWNPKYHSIDASRAIEGFYGVKNALGRGGKTLWISSFEAEGQKKGFQEFWEEDSAYWSAYWPFLATALQDGFLRLFFTSEPFEYCVPKSSGNWTLLAMCSRWDVPFASKTYAYWRTQREVQRKAENAMRVEIIPMIQNAKALVSIKTLSAKARAQRERLLAKCEGMSVNSNYQFLVWNFQAGNPEVDPSHDWRNCSLEEAPLLIMLCEAVLTGDPVSGQDVESMTGRKEELRKNIDRAKSNYKLGKTAFDKVEACWKAHHERWTKWKESYHGPKAYGIDTTDWADEPRRTIEKKKPRFSRLVGRLSKILE